MLEIVVQVHSATYIIGIDLVMLLVEIFFEFLWQPTDAFFWFFGGIFRNRGAF